MRLVDISNLVVSFAQSDGVVQAVRGLSLHVDAGESLGIVGESGSGKSVTCMAVLRLLREPPEGAFSTNVLWSRAIEDERLYGVAFTGQWFEVGTPGAIAPTEAALRDG